MLQLIFSFMFYLYRILFINFGKKHTLFDRLVGWYDHLYSLMWKRETMGDNKADGRTFSGKK